MYTVLNKKLLLLISFITTFGHSFAQTKYSEDDFEIKPINYPKIIDKLYDEYPAYLIYQTQHINLNNTGYSETVRRKLKIQNSAAIDIYSYFTVMVTEDQKITKVDARIKKQNGSLINISNKSIVSSEMTIKNDDLPDYRIFQFSIPNVEVGDEVEYVYTISSDEILKGKDISLYTFLPVVLSEFKLNNYGKAFTKIISWNIERLPEQSNKNTTYFYEEKNLPPLGINELRASTTYNYPFFTIIVKEIINNDNSVSTIVANNWGEIALKKKNKLKYKKRDLPYYGITIDQFLNDWLNANSKSSLLETVNAFNKYINEQIQIVNLIPKESEMPMYFYIKNKYISKDKLFNLYTLLFDKIKIKYGYVFAKNKFIGSPLNLKDPSLHQVAETFFVFYINNELHYLVPNNINYKFRLDEVPYYLTSENVMIVDFSNLESKNEIKQYSMKLDGLESIINSNIKNISMTYNSGSNVAKVKIKEKYSGDFAWLMKHQFENVEKKLNLNEYFSQLISTTFSDVNKIDSFSISYDSVFPYSISVNYTFETNELFNKTNTSALMLDLSKISEGHRWESDNRERLTVYISPFKFNHRTNIQLNFDKPVELVEHFNFPIIHRDATGSFEAKLNNEDKKKYIIRFEQEFTNDNIHPNNYLDFHTTNAVSAEKMSNKLLFEYLQAKKPATTNKKTNTK